MKRFFEQLFYKKKLEKGTYIQNELVEIYKLI